MGTVEFGILFEKTQESMPALAATLAVAKKRGVVCNTQMQITSVGVL